MSPADVAATGGRPRRSATRRAVGLLVLLAAAGAAVGPARAAPPPPPDTPPGCSPHQLAVQDPEGAPLGRVAVWWCGPRAASVVHVTVPGTTYDHNYWDFPYRPEQYSYRRWATARGIAVVLHDRIGTGASSRPPAAAVDVDAHAAVLHQLVQAVRAGRFGNAAPEVLVTIGHSQGALVAASEAARHGDVDGTILSGISHQINPSGAATTLLALLQPAQAEPRFATEPLGYLTTRAGTRQEIFYHGDVDAKVVETDEQTKTVASAGEFSMAQGMYATTRLTAPTLLALGEHDNIFCATPCRSEGPTADLERAWFGPECFEIAIQPGAGHDQNLHRNAPVFFGHATDWSTRLAAARRAGGRCPRAG